MLNKSKAHELYVKCKHMNKHMNYMSNATELVWLTEINLLIKGKYMSNPVIQDLMEFLWLTKPEWLTEVNETRYPAGRGRGRPG